MRRVKRTLVAVVLTSLVLLGTPVPSSALPTGTVVRRYKSGLDFPVDMAWVKGTKRIFFTEKNTGKIRIVHKRRLLTRACVDLDVFSEGEGGALGIVLHPHFKRTHWLYVHFTNRSPRVNRVVRFRVQNNRCRHPKRITSGLAASSYHNGGQLVFVEGKLFVSTGEAHDPALAQDRSSRAGKILRFNPDGSVPEGNPFGRHNPVWSYGHRNPFGLAHEPGTGHLFETENGPECDDELNRIRRGANYGWGAGYTCGTAGVGSRPRPPLRRWTPPIVPTDPWWYEGRMSRLSGDLYMGDFRGALHRFSLNAQGSRLRRGRVIHRGAAIVDVSKGPGGWLYFMTPGALLRIVPR
jgi:aldose sugar dehydrogenase